VSKQHAAVPAESLDESRMQQSANGEMLQAVLGKLDEVLAAQSKMLTTQTQLLATVHRQDSQILELRQEIIELKTPPTKSELAEQLREARAENELLRQEIAELKAKLSP
jgi:FtsZ-binding cell division protein ZapB